MPRLNLKRVLIMVVIAMTIDNMPATVINPALQQLRLLQLASPSLPVGSYAYSQGLESAVEAGWVRDRHTLEQWLQGIIGSTLARVDVPVFSRLYMAWQSRDMDKVTYWNNYLIASRETMELRNEERVRGMALWNLLQGMACVEPGTIPGTGNISYLCAYAFAAHHWHINCRDAALACVWGWAENQVLAAIKLMPVGQLAGQTLLGKLLETMTEVVAEGMVLEEDEIGALLPACTMASVLHETQYSRLFRS